MRKIITVTPTIDTAPYSSGDSVGGPLTVIESGRFSSQVVILENLVISDQSDQKAAMQIFFFDDNPSGATLTNNAAAAFTAADIAKIAGRLAVAGADFVTLPTGMATASYKNLGLIVKPAADGKIYLAMVTTGTPTYAVGALTLKFGFSTSLN